MCFDVISDLCGISVVRDPSRSELSLHGRRTSGDHLRWQHWSEPFWKWAWLGSRFSAKVTARSVVEEPCSRRGNRRGRGPHPTDRVLGGREQRCSSLECGYESRCGSVDRCSLLGGNIGWSSGVSRAISRIRRAPVATSGLVHSRARGRKGSRYSRDGSSSAMVVAIVHHFLSPYGSLRRVVLTGRWSASGALHSKNSDFRCGGGLLDFST